MFNANFIYKEHKNAYAIKGFRDSFYRNHINNARLIWLLGNESIKQIYPSILFHTKCITLEKKTSLF